MKISLFRLMVVGVALSGTTPATAQRKISVDGSTGSAPLVAALGNSFSAKTGITVEIGKGLGTKARIEALSSGKIDMAMASHGLDVEAVTD